MPQHILVPLDGSPFAEKALPLAMDLAQLYKAEISLLRVVSHESRLKDAEDYIRGQADRVTHNRLQCKHEVVMGNAATKIVELSHNARMVVMASHGHSEHHTLVLGCVAQEVMRAAHCPVLIVKSKAARLSAIHRVLVPLDGFGLSNDALGAAHDIARKNEAELLLARVSDQPGLDPGTPQREEESKKVSDFFDEVVSGLDPKLTIKRLHGFGSPARYLLELLEDSKIDLVVMTSHGQGGYKRWLCGSVAENLVRGSDVPLFIIRPPSTVLTEQSKA